MIALTDGMLLYHGSYTEISAINLEMCAAGKDFGKGFYVTASRAQAHRLALELLRPNKLEDQYCFRSEKAIATLEFIGSEAYDANL